MPRRCGRFLFYSILFARCRRKSSEHEPTEGALTRRAAPRKTSWMLLVSRTLIFFFFFFSRSFQSVEINIDSRAYDEHDGIDSSVIEDKDFSRDVATVPTMSAVAAPSRSFLSQTRRYYHARSSSGSHRFSPTLYQLFLSSHDTLFVKNIDRKNVSSSSSNHFDIDSSVKSRDPKLISKHTTNDTGGHSIHKGAQNKRVDGKRCI